MSRAVHSMRAVCAWIVCCAACSLAGQVASAPKQGAETFRQAGIAQATSGHIDEAIGSFKRGLALEPANPSLLDAIGAAYSMKGDLETAKSYFIEGLKADPNSMTTRQNLGIVLFTLGQYDDAAQQFSKLQDLAGKAQPAANLFLGLIAQRRSDCSKAISLMESSGDLLYRYPDALISYSECAYEQGDRVRAKHGLEAFHQLPGSTAAQKQKAAELSARAGWSGQGSGNRHDAETALHRAAVLEQKGGLEGAQNVLGEAAAGSPTFDVLLELAEIAKRRGDFALAMKSLKRASEIDPGREESYLEFSTICADHGNDQLALETAEIGLDHVPNSYRLTVQKGAVQEKLGHLQDAEQTLQKALALQKDNSIALASLAVVQAHSGRPQEAERTLANAIARFPGNYYMQYFRGKLLMQFANAGASPEQRDLARNSLEKSIELNPNYADAYYQISDLYLEASPQRAEQVLRKCLQLDPTHIPAQYALARLLIRTGRKSEGEGMLARMKTQQRTEEMQQQKQLRIEVAQK